MKKILTVSCEIPGGYGKHVEFTSKISLFDGDIVVFNPNIEDFVFTEKIQGQEIVVSSASQLIREAMEHWREEISAYLNTGLNVFMLLEAHSEVIVRNGERHSRTGQSRKPVATAMKMCNYDLLPFPLKSVGIEGSSMTLAQDAQILEDYWNQFGDESTYRTYFQKSNFIKPLVTTPNVERIVGAVYQHKCGGALVMLPWVDIERDEFFTENGDWTAEAKKWGCAYLKSIESLDKALKSNRETTPMPEWVEDCRYITLRESEIAEKQLEIKTNIDELKKKLNLVEGESLDAGRLRGLLFEKGHQLEKSVLEAMRLLGFEANSYRGSDTEIDVILECSEGRLIGEIEGKDRKAINIEKMRQLESNIQEDFSREEISEYAKGILFGNAHRLTPPPDRPPEHFTTKCLKAAERNGAALIRTVDLFDAAKYLADTGDTRFAALCREAILNSHGKEVAFPNPS